MAVVNVEIRHEISSFVKFLANFDFFFLNRQVFKMVP